jgi:hypothetical protein
VQKKSQFNQNRISAGGHFCFAGVEHEEENDQRDQLFSWFGINEMFDVSARNQSVLRVTFRESRMVSNGRILTAPEETALIRLIRWMRMMGIYDPT